MDPHLQNLHALEDHIFEIEYLIKALQQLPDDNGVRLSLLTVMEQKLAMLKTVFYRHWRDVV